MPKIPRGIIFVQQNAASSLMPRDVIVKIRNYFLFLAITSAPPATTAIPATAAIPSTPVLGEPLESEGAVGAGAALSSAGVLSSAGTPPLRPLMVNVTEMESSKLIAEVSMHESCCCPQYRRTEAYSGQREYQQPSRQCS